MLNIYGLVGKASNVTTKKASNRNQPFWKMFKSNKEYIAKHSLLGKKADKSFQCGQALRHVVVKSANDKTDLYSASPLLIDSPVNSII